MITGWSLPSEEFFRVDSGKALTKNKISELSWTHTSWKCVPPSFAKASGLAFFKNEGIFSSNSDNANSLGAMICVFLVNPNSEGNALHSVFAFAPERIVIRSLETGRMPMESCSRMVATLGNNVWFVVKRGMRSGLTTELTGRYRSDQGERGRTAERLSKRLTRRGSVRVERLVRARLPHGFIHPSQRK